MLISSLFRIAIIFITTSIVLSAQTKNVSVLKFTGKGVSATEAEAISDLFAVSISKIPAYKLLDRANMISILEEQSFQNSGCTDESCAVQIGKMLNMDFMFTGAVIKLGNKLFMTANKVSVESGAVEQSEKTPAFIMDNIEESINGLVSLFASKHKSLNIIPPITIEEEHEKKVLIAKKSKPKKNIGRVLSMVSGLSFLAIGGTYLGINKGLVSSSVDNLYSAYTGYSGIDQSIHADNWSAYTDKHAGLKAGYIVSYSLLGTGAALFLTSLFLPKNRKGKVLMSGGKEYFKLTYTRSF